MIAPYFASIVVVSWNLCAAILTIDKVGTIFSVKRMCLILMFVMRAK
jgi:hypothetical protein